MNRLVFGAAVASVLALTGVARADDDLPTWRLALVPRLGAGVAHMWNGAPFPSNVGMSIVGGEIDASLERVGLFAHIEFFSSGQDGRWTAGAYALGGSYRFFGDGYSSLGLVGRGGLNYELWHASNAGCNVGLFFPTNCKDFVPPSGSGIPNTGPARIDVSTDALGLSAGVRLELPVKAFFVAVDAEVAGMAALDSGTGNLLEARAVLVFGLRHRRSGDLRIDPVAPRGPRAPRGSSY